MILLVWYSDKINIKVEVYLDVHMTTWDYSRLHLLCALDGWWLLYRSLWEWTLRLRRNRRQLELIHLAFLTQFGKIKGLFFMKCMPLKGLFRGGLASIRKFHLFFRALPIKCWVLIQIFIDNGIFLVSLLNTIALYRLSGQPYLLPYLIETEVQINEWLRLRWNGLIIFIVFFVRLLS